MNSGVFDAERSADGSWLGERHHPETHLIPNVLAAATDGRLVQIFGDDVWAYGVLPKHLLDRYRSLDNVDFFAKRPVGSGPFEVESWRRGDRMVLDRLLRDSHLRPSSVPVNIWNQSVALGVAALAALK